jgi:hypothetical protein
MSVVDLHPEELLDKDARGALSGDEHVRLETHLARCSACRAERLLRRDFADELDDEPLVASRAPSPAEVAAHERSSRAPSPAEVARTPKETSGVEMGPSRRHRPRRTAVVLVVAAAVLAAGVAGATGLTFRDWLGLRGSSQDPTRTIADPLAFAGTARTSRPAMMPLSAAPARGLVSDPDPAFVVDPSSAPQLVMASGPALAPPRAVDSARAPSFAPSPTFVSMPAFAPASAFSPAPASSFAPGSASALFDAANTARRAGETALALSRYDALGAKYPTSPEAHIAKAISAKLLLDRGDAAGALTRFDAYLASGSSTLREEAMAGRATALERLGREDEEARAWAALVSTYPGTPYASHARLRVGTNARP